MNNLENKDVKKVCKICNEELPISLYYSQKIGDKIVFKPYCKSCCKEIIKTKRTLEYDETNGYEYYSEPFLYTTPEQQQDVEELLYILGYQWSEDNKLYFKPGVKTPDGIWKYKKDVK